MREAHKPNLNYQIYVHLLRNKKAVWRSKSVVMDRILAMKFDGIRIQILPPIF